MKILMLDDEIEVCRHLQRQLRREGGEVECITSPMKALARLHSAKREGEPYELLLINIDMPAVSGLELLKEVTEAGLDLDVIVISGDVGEDQAMEAISLGAIDYLRKPISLDELRTALFRVRQRQAAKGEKVLKSRILVVDDEEDLAARMKRELEREGYEVAVAYDGIEGLEYFKNNHVDTVIADIRMPGSNGLDMLAECRALNPDFVPIVITGFGDHEKAIKSLKLGAFEYLKKPISIEELISAVTRGTEMIALRRGLPARKRELEIESALKTRYARKLEEEIAERKHLEEQLKDTVEKLRTNQQELSTPVVQIWDRVLALPLIGVVDSHRAQNIMETLLRRIVETQSEMVILDITGVSSIDTQVANHLIKIIRAAKLLGAECVITGIRPKVAQTMIQLGLDMESFPTRRNLRDGLIYGLKKLGYNIEK